jgi:hypothetical protein
VLLQHGSQLLDETLKLIDTILQRVSLLGFCQTALVSDSELLSEVQIFLAQELIFGLLFPEAASEDIRRAFLNVKSSQKS